MKKRSFVQTNLSVAVAVACLIGCSPDRKPKTGVCDGGVSQCSLTAPTPYGCLNFWGTELGDCFATEYEANAWCLEHGGGPNAAYALDCSDYAGETGEGDGDGDGDGDSWVPRDYVTEVDEGEYVVDYALIYQIKNDFTLLENDSNILVESAMSDYFELSGVASGDLADVLGLQTGDILYSVNGESLNGIDDAIAAYSEVENDSTLVLVFYRSNAPYTHTYYVSYTQ